VSSTSLLSGDGLLGVRVYQSVILKEVSIVSGEANPLNRVLHVRNYSYCLSYDDLVRIAEGVLCSRDRAREVIEELLSEGFIIPVGEGCFRSFHMDFLLRLSDVRLYPGASRMVLSSRFGVTFIPVFSRESRVILPEKGGCGLCRELYRALADFMGREDVVELLGEALRRYFRGRGSKGFDPYQASALVKALREGRDGYVIIAPTGSGKTEVFLTLGISLLLKDLIKGRRGRIVIVYPRKMLEIDQMGRVIRLLKELNELLSRRLGIKLRVFLRDGDTSKIREALEKEGVVDFRGITCGKSGKLLVKKVGEGYKVVCSEGGEEYDFVIPAQCGDAKNADIVITTWNTLMYRLVDTGKPGDIDVRDVLNTSVLILDEAHEYDSVQAAIMSYTISILRELRKEAGRELRCIVSTATLPDYLNYAAALLNLAKEDITDLSFEPILPTLKHEPQHRRLVITLFIQMLPKVSWITYLAEAVAAQLLLFRMYRELRRRFLPQAIVFINNVREVNRARAVIENQLSLGSPLDNLCVRRYSCDGMGPRDFRNILSHYLLINKGLGEKIREIAKGNKHATLYDDLGGLCSVVFSGVSLKERSEIYEKMLRGDLATLLATSSLELGMDYSTISIIFNVGIDKPESIIQRFGRGGRSLRTNLVTLAVQIMRNNPLDYRLFNMRQTLENIISQNLGHRTIRIPRENDAIKLRMLLNLALILHVLRSGTSGTKKIRSETDITNLLEGLKEAVKDERFVELAKRCGLVIEPSHKFQELLHSYIEKLQDFYLNKEYIKILGLLENVPDKSLVSSLVNRYSRRVHETIRAAEEVRAAYLRSRTRPRYIEEPKLNTEKLKEILESIKDLLESYRNTFMEIHNTFEELQEELYRITAENLKRKRISELSEKLERKNYELNKILRAIKERKGELTDEVSAPIDLCNVHSSNPEYQEPCEQFTSALEDIEELQKVLRGIIPKLGKVINDIKAWEAH